MFRWNDKLIIELRDKQPMNPDPILVIKWLTSSYELEFSNVIRWTGWQLLRQINKFYLNDDVLVHRVKNMERIQQQVVVPWICQPEILREFYDDPAGGHMSCDEMLDEICVRYIWLIINEDVKRICKCCLNCYKFKPFYLMPVAWLQPIMCSRVFEMASMDVCGDYPTSERKNDTFLSSPIILQNGLKLTLCRIKKKQQMHFASNNSWKH